MRRVDEKAIVIASDEMRPRADTDKHAAWQANSPRNTQHMSYLSTRESVPNPIFVHSQYYESQTSLKVIDATL